MCWGLGKYETFTDRIIKPPKWFVRIINKDYYYETTNKLFLVLHPCVLKNSGHTISSYRQKSSNLYSIIFKLRENIYSLTGLGLSKISPVQTNVKYI